MRQAEIYVDDHPLKGEIITLENKEYLIGSIWRVDGTKRLYISLICEGTTLNYPLHEIAKMLYDA